MTKKKILLIAAVLCVVLAIVIAGGLRIRNMENELAATKAELSNYTVDESTISSCPFCGSEDVTIMDVSGNETRYCVHCNNCSASGPIYHSKNDFSDMSKQDAITLWNKASKGE